MSFASDIDDKVDGLFGNVDRGARPSSGQRGAVADLRRVPRPARPVQPGKIDLSRAPSSMEEAAKRWSGR